LAPVLDLRNAQDGWIRQRIRVVGLRTVHDLQGTPCHELDTQPSPKKTTCCSRTFGNALTNKDQVRDSIVSFAEHAAEKRIRAGVHHHRPIRHGVATARGRGVINLYVAGR